MQPLDQNSVIPLYHQLKERIYSLISQHELKADDKIPSEYELMQQYHVSRNTVKKAIEELVQEDILYRIQGKGTFVASARMEQSLTGFYSFSKVMKEKGLNPKDIILDVSKVKPSNKVITGLKLEKDESVIQIKRIRCANNEPIILETSFIPSKLIPDMDTLSLLGQHSLYDLLERECGIIVTKAKEAFEPVLIKENESKHLDVQPGFPALLLERTAYDSIGNIVEFCVSTVRGDRCRFYTELL